MSCLDVMYHQSHGAHYLPAAAYKATYYNQQQQQRKLSVYNKMQECMDQQSLGSRAMLPHNLHRQAAGSDPTRRSPMDGDLKDSNQPAGAEYLSARCVLFTYFKGEIGDVVDEHFSRALSQASSFTSEGKPIRVTQPAPSTSTGAWKDGSSPLESPSHSGWTTSCPSQPSAPVHPDFSTSPVSFPPEGSLWTGHVFSQNSLAPPPPSSSLSDSWSYSLGPQTTSSYPTVHDVYHAHSHSHSMHPRHAHPHPMLQSYAAHSSTLDPRFSPLLLPSVRNQSQTSASSSPLSDGVKTELDASSPNTPISWAPTSIQGSIEMYDSNAYARRPQLSTASRLLP
ncbi:transcription cofactor vestigial-like protein 3 [Eucyclogobius newberryi]|uniref:transcription cofactor vestigial-like protein 3 n=1 Tax=Eucyclogobius newberryi TaxID=166745 RepID=UPI003B594AED